MILLQKWGNQGSQNIKRLIMQKSFCNILEFTVLPICHPAHTPMLDVMPTNLVGAVSSPRTALHVFFVWLNPIPLLGPGSGISSSWQLSPCRPPTLTWWGDLPVLRRCPCPPLPWHFLHIIKFSCLLPFLLLQSASFLYIFQCLASCLAHVQINCKNEISLDDLESIAVSVWCY